MKRPSYPSSRRRWIVSTALAAVVVSSSTVGLDSASAAPNCVDYTYRLGSQSGCVKFLQIMGNFVPKPGADVPVDGKYGIATYSMVIQIDLTGRTSIHARTDGVAERQTWFLACNPQIGPTPANVLKARKAAGCDKTRNWYHL